MITDRTRIFLGAFWIWTWIVLQFNKLCALCLTCLLSWVPDKCVPYSLPLIRCAPVKIIKALDGAGNTITNKLNLFLNLRWNNETYGGEGHVDVDDFARYVGSGVIWAAYLLEYELSPVYKQFIDATKRTDFNVSDFDMLLKAILIDLSNKIVYKLHSDKNESVNFGEVNFY